MRDLLASLRMLIRPYFLMILQQITHTISSVLSTLATLPSAENTANRPSVTVSKLYLDPQKVTHKHKRQTNAIDL